MPVSIKKTKGGQYRVSTPGGVKAKGTTKAKAQRQANLLRGVEHGWKPTGRRAQDLRRVKGSPMHYVVDKVTRCGPPVETIR